MSELGLEVLGAGARSVALPVRIRSVRFAKDGATGCAGMVESLGRPYPQAMKPRLGSVLLVALALWIGACASSPPDSPAPLAPSAPSIPQDPLDLHLAGVQWEQPAAWKFQLAEGGDYAMAWRPLAGELTRNEYQELEVRFYRRGEPLEGLVLEVLGWMPAHGHGFLRRAQVQAREPGVFQVKGVLFHMRGAWELTFDVAQAQRVDKLVFEVEL